MQGNTEWRGQTQGDQKFPYRWEVPFVASLFVFSVDVKLHAVSWALMLSMQTYTGCTWTFFDTMGNEFVSCAEYAIKTKEEITKTYCAFQGTGI